MKDILSLLNILDLKDEERAGWKLRNIDNPESVADHSWSSALLCIIYGDRENVNVSKCVKMALIHDLAEAETGDIAYRAVDAKQEISKEEKEILENNTITQISEDLSKNEILDLWKEYEERNTPEAKFMKDMDLIDLCLTALKYEKQGRYNPKEENNNFQKYERLDEFFATTEPRLNTDTGKKLFQEIKKRYKEAKK